MKLNAELAGQNHELNIRREGSRVFAEVDSRHYEFELRELDSGTSLLIDSNRVFECRVTQHREQGGLFEVNIGTHNYAITVIDPKRLRSAQSSGGHDHGAARILAPMPGKIVRLLVEVGTHVEPGAGIVVVEAMKMQNEMKAPKAGTVVAINAEAGATVNAGDVLAVIE
jgi:biotin carboxyl carrier protein